MLNSVILMGRITKDLELKSTGSGTSVLGFSVANDTGYGDNKQTAFIECTAWGKTAENIAKFFGKGSLIILKGELKQRDWTDKNSNKHIVTYFNVSSFEFSGEKPKTNTNAAKGYEPKAQQNNAPVDLSGFEEILSDDENVPF